MKQSTIIALSIWLISALAVKGQNTPPKATQTGFTVDGDIKGLTASVVYLQPLRGDGLKDTATVTNGHFTFKGSLTAPTRYYIADADYSFKLDFILENSKVLITGTQGGACQVKGSTTQNEDQQLQSSLAAYTSQARQLNTAYNTAKANGDRAALDKINGEWTGLADKKRTAIMAFIRQHPSSYVSMDQLSQLTSNQQPGVDTLKELYEGLDGSLRNTDQGKDLAIRIQKLSPLFQGYPAPQFTLPDVNGKAISLADYKGKYVLLDFWASWCAPCRAENPNVLRAYDQYHPKGLEILSVSLDDKKDRWTKAIAEDKLSWNQVSDLKGWDSQAVSLYKLNGIPDNFLIDPQGKIIARGLRGDALERALAQVLK